MLQKAPNATFRRRPAQPVTAVLPLNVLLLDRMPLFLEALSLRVARDTDLRLVGVAGPAGASALLRDRLSVDVLVIDCTFEVLSLVVGGLTNTQIAHRLSISPRTVAKHVEHTLAKLGVAGRTEAAARATRQGLVLVRAPGALPTR
jgi:DNA-binding NarL/FixJ family response regulator